MVSPFSFHAAPRFGATAPAPLQLACLWRAGILVATLRATVEQARTFPCTQCGASVEYKPGTTSLQCPYCGSQQAVPAPTGTVEELDFDATLAEAMREDGALEVVTARCRACGAESTLAPNVTADRCPFCGTTLSAASQSKRLLRPRSLLPFGVPREDARSRFRAWASGLWFAPNALAADARSGQIDGVYLPFWTFDCRTGTAYRGERGDDYVVRESYQTVENGRTVTRTRDVTHTRWSDVSGHVAVDFDDVLVTATRSLPADKLTALEPWDLPQLVPFEETYLSGFRTESWSVPLPDAFTHAQKVMAATIRTTIARDIGGDHQRIHGQDTRYADVRCKHLLLPVWVSSYTFGGKVYRFLVNARTGEVQGERPWSWIKIALAVLLAFTCCFFLLIVMAALSSRDR